GLRKAGIKSVLTIHDLIFRVYPETYPIIDRKIYDLKFRHSCQNADTIIAISKSTQADIVKFYDINPDKIEVIYQSCNPLYFKQRNERERIEILERNGIPSEY